jgi:hypothetical protein
MEAALGGNINFKASLYGHGDDTSMGYAQNLAIIIALGELIEDVNRPLKDVPPALSPFRAIIRITRSVPGVIIGKLLCNLGICQAFQPAKCTLAQASFPDNHLFLPVFPADDIGTLDSAPKVGSVDGIKAHALTGQAYPEKFRLVFAFPGQGAVHVPLVDAFLVPLCFSVPDDKEGRHLSA